MQRKPGDLVLIYVKDSPSFYGRIEKIEPDIKPGWYQVTFLFLGIPARSGVWILREEYIDGETFTMGGTPLRIELVPPYQETVFAADTIKDNKGKEAEQTKDTKEKPTPKVIPLKPKS
jgi:hypothetical protein